MQMSAELLPQGLRQTALDKKQAAQQQLEAAIGLFTAGLFAAATTLAYAAENCVPKQDDGTIFRTLVKKAVETGQLENIERFRTEKKAKEEVNLAPRWLRHNDIKNVEVMPELDVEAFVMIYRAISALKASYPDDEYNGLTPQMSVFIMSDGNRLTMENGRLKLLPPPVFQRSVVGV